MTSDDLPLATMAAILLLLLAYVLLWWHAWRMLQAAARLLQEARAIDVRTLAATGEWIPATVKEGLQNPFPAPRGRMTRSDFSRCARSA